MQQLGPDGRPGRGDWVRTTDEATSYTLASARWLLGVLGAGGAGVVAGSQLSGVGRLGVEDARLWVAVAATLVAAAGAALAIRGVLGVGSGEVDVEHLTAAELAHAQDWGYMRGFPNSEAYFAHRASLVGVWDKMQDPAVGQLWVPREQAVDARLPTLRGDLTESDWTIREVSSLIAHYRVRRRYTRAERRVWAGASLVLVGLAVLIWAGNPPEQGSSLTRVVIVTPVPVATPLP